MDFSAVEGTPPDPSDLLIYCSYQGNPNSPNDALRRFNETYLRGEPLELINNTLEL